VGAFVDWTITNGFASGPNAFKAWCGEHARLFKNSYNREITTMSLAEAQSKIAQIKDENTRKFASFMLLNGLRWVDAYHAQEGYVLGKGGKRRRLYSPPPPIRVSYASIYRALKAVGLKPHDLRKIFLNRALEKGAQIHEVKELAGWSSITTADSYVRANDGRLAQIVREVQNDH
jgi:integrase